MNLKIDKSSVRADSSGSRGKADEEQGDAKILFPTHIKVKLGDIVSAEDSRVRIIHIFPRRSVTGVLSHYETILRPEILA